MFKKIKTHNGSKSLSLLLMASLLAGVGLGFTAPLASASGPTPLDLIGPAGSSVFGWDVVVLANGNVVVDDPGATVGGAANAGAVYLYNGVTGALISTLTGSSGGDQVGEGLVQPIGNTGNYVVLSALWRNGGQAGAGAVTWCSGVTGCAGVVSAANSLVGSTAFDEVAGSGVVVLANGSYVVVSPQWANGGQAQAGAVTWCSGAGGCTGAVSAANSLVGTTAYDQVGWGGVKPLSNGHYVVSSPYWANGGQATAGAVTWCNGAGGCTGAVSPANSLVGTTANDQVGVGVGLGGIQPLSNGNYVVSSAQWANGAQASAGAVTWCSGAGGCTGAVSPANSLVGSTASDRVSSNSLKLLSNGHYVVSSPHWANGGLLKPNAGAATWCSGAAACTGAVSPANSLVGSTAGDQVGAGGIQPLSNGNYVVVSAAWTNSGVASAGAATWCSGAGGCTGPISAANSLVGTTANDMVSSLGVMAIGNGNYVVDSPKWANGTAALAGAVTCCSGAAGCQGAVSAANSLVGTTTGDKIGAGIKLLGNGNYVVSSPQWANGGLLKLSAGAATWCSSAAGCAGAVSASNSLVGNTPGDQVSSQSITGLSNGSYVVSSPNWANSGVVLAGAVTWCSAGGCTGLVSAANSLVGTTASDTVGSLGISGVGTGNYVVRSPNWANSGVALAGAATWCSSAAACTGAVSAANSLVGTTANDQVGGGSIQPLSNGSYVVASPLWANSGIALAGAATWCSSAGGCTGAVSPANSLVGSTAGDHVGAGIVLALSNGSYVVVSPSWANGGQASAGAVTWCNGAAGCTGAVSPANSLVGSMLGDLVGNGPGVTITGNDYAIESFDWTNAGAAKAGAMTLLEGNTPVGPVAAGNSFVGTHANRGNQQHIVYWSANHVLTMSSPVDNKVRLYHFSFVVYLPTVRR